MRRRFLIVTALVDLLLLVVAMGIGSAIVFGDPRWWVTGPNPGDLLPLASFLVAGLVAGSAVSSRVWGSGVPRPSYARTFWIASSGLLASSAGIVLFRTYWSRSFLAWTIVTWLLGMLVYRFAQRRRPWTEPLLVISDHEELVLDLKGSPHAGIDGVIDPHETTPPDPVGPPTTLVVDYRSQFSPAMTRYITAASLSGVSIAPMTQVYEDHTGRLPISHLAEGWELLVPVARTGRWMGGKRIFDVTVTLLTAPLWLPILGLGALLVAVGSRGPVIFHQRRVGLGGREFTLHKLRTMRSDADESGAQFATEDDDRIVPLGRFLRRFRIDELPQLVNVLAGDLSLVGPRPEQVPFVRQFEARIPFYSQRHLVRPGITGWAQVNYGYAASVEETMEKLMYDLYYVKHASPVLDARVLFKSVGTVLTGAGAR